MLDSLQYLLQHATDPSQRDIFVELTLTVPVRLTNLLPHLGYLMAPLVHALKAGPDLVSQGLRTLELCIDNLTSEFLDPTMGPVLRDLMSALHQLLKPIPANRAHANTAVKILGKLGGRNRRFHEVDHLLEYSPSTTTAPLSFDSSTRIDLSSAVSLGALGIEDDDYSEDGLTMLILSAMAIVQEVSLHKMSTLTTGHSTPRIQPFVPYHVQRYLHGLSTTFDLCKSFKLFTILLSTHIRSRTPSGRTRLQQVFSRFQQP